MFPRWEIPLEGRRNLDEVIEAFGSTTTTVPLRASSEQGNGWKVWLDGGYASHRFINAKLSRTSYVSVLSLLLRMMLEIQARYPDLYAVVKFVPKKNGLNPTLAALLDGVDPQSMQIDGLKPREVRRRLDDLGRALSQTWCMLACYLTLPGREERADFLWSARTVVEKVKTDQRSRAIEMLCLGFFSRSSSLYPLVTAVDAYDEETRFTLKGGFEKNFGVDVWSPKPTNARMIWQRSRMVYPFLEVAHRAWLDQTGMALGTTGVLDCNVIFVDDDDDPSLLDDYDPSCGDEADEENSKAIGELLDVIARASPEEKVLNSLLYWLIDLCYKVMLEGEDIKPWDPEPFILRREGVEQRLVSEIARLGHLLQLLYQSEHVQESRGSELLLQVKEVETTTTLLSSIKSSCADACPEVLMEYDELMGSTFLTLSRLETLEFDALGALLGVDSQIVRARAETVRKAMREWRNPELLFRYLDDNRHDKRMYDLILRWQRAIFGLSHETLRQIRRESPANVRHLLMIPQDVLLRWYSEECPGTSKCKTLFMLGEDAGSCLRIISNDGNKYNRALMGYVLQSHVRALVVTDPVGRVMCRSLIRLVLRSDTLTPVIFCDPMFFTVGYSRELQRDLLEQARWLEEHMKIPVVHAGSVLPVVGDGELCEGFCFEAEPENPDGSPCLDDDECESEDSAAARGVLPRRQITFESGYVREAKALDYEMIWVELLEMDGVAPYTYSEELPYDDLLQQHTPGVQSRKDGESPILVVATLPRADSPSAKRYVAEREGETAWTMNLSEKDMRSVEKVSLPDQVGAQIGLREHVSGQATTSGGTSWGTFDPNARADDEGVSDVLPPNYKAPSLDE